MSEPLSIRVQDLFVDYEIYEDRRAAIRQRLVQRQGTGRRLVRALKGVSFDVSEGEAVGIIGSNGSGKSTMLAAIAGLLPPTSGDILVSDEPKLLGVGATLMFGANGYTNIRIGLLALGKSSDEVDVLTPEIAEFTGLGEALDRPFKTYSSGMRARLHFAIATSVHPKILLIDEALSVGDQAFKNKSRVRINKLLGDAGTLLFVSHSLSEVSSMCSRVIWLEKGRLRADGPPDRIIAKYESFVG